MIIINKKGKAKIEDLNLHDAEISKIICDYNQGTVEMPIIMAEKRQYAALIKFENILHTEVKHQEPWGMGINIFSVNVDDAEGDYFQVSILLNSGDVINVTAGRMIYSSDN